MTEIINPSYSVLQEPWWWDATALSGWEQVEIVADTQVVARWPFVRTEVAPGIIMLSAPPLTNRAGPWVMPIDGKTCTRYSRTADWLQQLVHQLPRCTWFVQNLHPVFENWMPLFWNGFQVESRISYVIDDCSDSVMMEANLNEAARRQVRKGKRNLGIEEISTGRLIDLIRKTFKRQGKGMRVQPAVLESVMSAIYARQAGRAIAAVDSTGRAHAAALFVWDSTRMYYLVGGGDPNLRSSGAGTYVLWEGLNDAGRRGLVFDFEGSMMPNVERFFRGFGAHQTTYLSVSKGSPFVRLAWSMAKSFRK